jgi:hypothetical protein
MEIKKQPTREQIIEMVVNELNRANTKYPTFNSTWEAFGVIYEEFDELKDEIREQKRGDYIGTPMITETVQLAAMCLKLLESLPFHTTRSFCASESIQHISV